MVRIATLLRQQRAGDWAPVLAQVTHELPEFLRSLLAAYRAKRAGTLTARLFWALASNAFLVLLPILDPSQ